MKYLDYREKRQHGQFNFPLAYYRETPQAPRYLMPFHWHLELELVHITSGSFRLTADRQEFHMNAGDSLLLPGGVLHGGTPENCIYECVVFHPRMLLVPAHVCSTAIQSLTDQSASLKTRVYSGETDFSSAAEQLCAVLEERKEGYEFLVQGYLYQLFGILTGNHEIVTEKSSAVHQKLDPVKKALSFIEAHYAEQIELKDIADAAGLNPNYLCRLFKSVTERTPIDYLRYYRIECACEMLAVRDISIPEVSWRCGYHDPSYFIRCFRKEKGITPAGYLRRKL